jgi:predicted oxidoreductase
LLTAKEESEMLDPSTLKAHRLAYGFWRYREDEVDAAIAMLALARERGVAHIDVADVYGGAGHFGGAERLLGRVRERAPSLFEGAILATKAGVEPGSPYNSSPDYLAEACDASLRRLGVERVDLFYVHRPDFLTHPAALAGALDRLVAAGKAGGVGVSNFTPAQVDALTRHLRVPLCAHQVEISLLRTAPLDDGVLDQAMRDGFAALAWSPLAGGRLETEADAPLRKAVADLAKRHSVAPSAVAVAFLLRHPAEIVPILGTKTKDRFLAALEAQECALARAEWYGLLEAARGAKMP